MNQAISFDLPDIGEGIMEAELVRWLVQKGDWITENQPICEIQTDKAVVELPSPSSGKVLSCKWKIGDLIPVGQTLVEIEPKGLSKPNVLASPSTRRLAREMGVDLDRIQGTGNEGRIVEKDVKQYAEGSESLSMERLTPNRQVIGDKLKQSLLTKPHATHFDEVDAEGLVEWKKQESLTYTPLLLKILAVTLQEHPRFNAHFYEENGQLERHSTISIGLATHTKQGLLVPVIHQVEQKSLEELVVELEELVEQARNGRIRSDQMTGSTFTLSNAGALGGQFATPIIQPPEVGILATHALIRKPVVLEDDTIAPQWRMTLSLSFDHRIFDGVDAIQFTQTFGTYTHNPRKLLRKLR